MADENLKGFRQTYQETGKLSSGGGPGEKNLDAGTYSIPQLVAKRVIRKGKLVKLLGEGKLTKKFTLSVHAASKTAKEAVKKAGGEIVMVKPEN